MDTFLSAQRVYQMLINICYTEDNKILRRHCVLLQLQKETLGDLKLAEKDMIEKIRRIDHQLI